MPDHEDTTVARGDDLRDRLAGSRTVAQACTVVADHLAEGEGLMPSIYLERGGRLRCQAARRYWQVLDGMLPGAGVIGTTFQTGEAALITAVEESSDYMSASPVVVSEICIPLVVGGRVIGAVNVEAPTLLGPDHMTRFTRLTEQLAARIAELGGGLAESPAQRLARHGSVLAGFSTEAEIGPYAVDAARSVSDLDSAMLLLRDATGALRVCAAAGPLGERFAALPTESIEAIATWVGSVSSAYTHGDETGQELPGHEQLREAGASTVVVLPLRAADERLGLLLVGDVDSHRPDTDGVALLELLASQTASTLATAAALAESRERASQDSLTGLGHHATFQAALAEATTPPGAVSKLAVLIVDLDGFKAVNDTHGHLAGDDLLRDVAAALGDALRDGDRLFRIGGDEFAALIRVHAEEEALEIAERLRGSIHRDRGVTGCVGVALAEGGEAADSLLTRADRALYKAKAAGRDGVALAEPAA